MMTHEELETACREGNREAIVTYTDGKKKKLRLFISSSNTLCYYGKGKHRWGYPMREFFQYKDVKSVDIVHTKVKTYYERHISNLLKFKKAFTKMVHPNLWSDLQAGYEAFDIAEYEKFLAENGYDKNSSLWDALRKFCQSKNIYVVYENNYKTTTIKGNAPLHNWKYRHDGFSQYEACIANIEKHLANKEDFYYSWRSNYDVTVEGHLAEKSGRYSANLSLEYKGCGNGHYYILINSNTAVFGEDD